MQNGVFNAITAYTNTSSTLKFLPNEHCMNNNLTAVCTLFCLFVTLQSATAQNKGTNTWPPKKWPHDPKNCHHLVSNAYQCKWQFFLVKGTMEGSIITYNIGKGDKEGLASVAIIKAGRDTVRAIFAGNTSHKPGDHVKIVSVKEPDEDLLAPFDRDYYISEEKQRHKPECRVNEYDATVLKTTWGKIVP
jgi:hypothetical protein